MHDYINDYIDDYISDDVARVVERCAPGRSGIKLDVTKDEVIGMMVRGLTSEPVDEATKAKEAVIRGNTNRSVGVTNLNEQSSRSHMIVTLTVFSTQLVNGNQRRNHAVITMQSPP